MEDLSRCFPVPPLTSPIDASSFDAAVSSLLSRCWSHDEGGSDASSFHRHHHSLYIGSLGPCCYVRYRLAASLEDGDADRLRLLQDASRAVEAVLGSHPESVTREMRVTLLEGKRVGALALSAAIYHFLGDLARVAHAKEELLDIGTRRVLRLPRGECEVLYGRAGFLHAVAFVRAETGDREYCKTLVSRIVRDILEEGERFAAESGSDLPLLWAWHGTAYLGAIHGVVGILHTLLCFHEEISPIEGSIEKIKVTTAKLHGLCFASGNLMSSIGSERDRLVHLCHGAPGLILYLVKAFEVLHHKHYLEWAEEVARNVICRRGLLKKGVGLCHGISGNAYCFLALYRARKLMKQRRGEADETSEDLSDEWLAWATRFAHFAVENIDDLFWVPDRPHSLYEGAAGLAMLLHDLRDPQQSRFPCFEH